MRDSNAASSSAAVSGPVGAGLSVAVGVGVAVGAGLSVAVGDCSSAGVSVGSTVSVAAPVVDTPDRQPAVRRRAASPSAASAGREGLGVIHPILPGVPG
jgi:hypothetical protein